MFEWLKLGASILTPVLVLVLGVIVARAARHVEEAQWVGRKLVERRLELHKEMAPLLNDLLCFFTWRGHFREVDPPEAITAKRTLDKVFYANEQLFGPEFRHRYREFIDAGFHEGSRAGRDAKLRTSVQKLKFERGEAAAWKPEWDSLFVDEPDAPSRTLVEDAYKRLMETFGDEVGVSAATPRKRDGRGVRPPGRSDSPSDRSRLTSV